MPRLSPIVVASAVAFALASAGPSFAQNLPTTVEVQLGLDDSCNTIDLIETNGPLNPPLELAECLAEIAGAVEVAAGYAALNPPDDPPQVEIGLMLCQLAITRPNLEPIITALILASENPLLLVGCQAILTNPAAGPGDGGVTPGVLTEA